MTVVIAAIVAIAVTVAIAARAPRLRRSRRPRSVDELELGAETAADVETVLDAGAEEA